jgi:hypothetical protein
VLEGSVQRSGKRLRMNVQLIDANSGQHLWAERCLSQRPPFAGGLFTLCFFYLSSLA